MAAHTVPPMTHSSNGADPNATSSRRRVSKVGVVTSLAGLAVSASIVAAVSLTGHADTAPANPADPSTPVTVSADALPTVQIDGVAWSQAVVGNTVYVGGNFANARPAGAAAGTNLTARSNFLAYDLTTGQLITSFAPTFNAQVRTVVASPDGTRLYVGGDFTSVNGVSRSRIAAFDLATGNLAPFFPSVAYNVHAVAVHPSGSPVYVGGNFNAVGSVARGQLAAFNASNGALLDWAPQATGGLVKAMAMSPDGTKIAVGGQFTALNGGNNPGFGLGMIDSVTGASLPMAINATVRNGGNTSGITSLVTNGNDIFGAGYWFGGVGNFEGTFSASWNGGSTNWIADCHGDTHSVFVQGDAVYNVGHAHECGGLGVGAFQRTDPWVFNRGIAFSRSATGTLVRDPYGYFNFEGTPSPSLLNFFPTLDTGTFTGQYQGPWNVAGNSQYVVMGGEFRNVNDTAQQGLVRFAVSSIAPDKQIPRLFLSNWLPRAVSVNPGEVRLTWSGNWDRDNEYFTYQVFRDTDGNRVYTGSGRSTWYEMEQYGFTDTGLTPGSTVRYRVKAIDAFGNEAPSDWVTVTVGGGTTSAYAPAALADRPLNYWRLGESTGAAVNAASYDNLTVNGSVTRGQAGAVPGDADTAVRFNGASTQYASTTATRLGRHTFSVEAWFRTNSTSGGKIIGFGNRSTGNSTSFDRHLYVGNDGRVRFGVAPASGARVLSSPSSLVDNAWHHVVGTLGGGVMTLYVDGQQVGQLSGVPMAANYQGFWRVGGDNVSGWANRPVSDYFNGTIDEAAVYPRALTAAEVAQHHAVGSTGATPNQAPTASFTATTSPLQVAVNGSASTDPDGTIVSYGWDFGNGTLATGATASGTYAAPGTYTVTLTVTDDDGGIGTTSRQVIVPDVPANQAPTASFTATTSPLAVAVNGSASTDADGTIVTHGWDFGDGGTATGATASHAYAAAGTYTVTLTVTDDDGGIGTTSQTVVVPDVPVNGAPTATFSATTSPLAVAVNASASTDDGTIVSYGWDFGDATTGTGVSATHTYASAGTYTIVLTVTDDQGATGTSSQSVVVPALPVGPQPVATDAFERTVTDGLGSADLGGAWTLSGSAPNFSVSGGRGRLRMSAAATGVSAFLAGTATDTEVRAQVGIDKVGTGGGIYSSVVARRVGTADYRGRVRFMAGGSVQIFITRNQGGETNLANLVVPGLTVGANEMVNVRFQATGTSPTTLRLKVWKVGTPEPAGWQLTSTDSTAGLQSGGGIGLVTYLSGSATNAPVLGLFDEIWAGPTA
jgi:PKD repeat protein